MTWKKIMKYYILFTFLLPKFVSNNKTCVKLNIGNDDKTTEVMWITKFPAYKFITAWTGKHIMNILYMNT
jgi:hypothetical protein